MRDMDARRHDDRSYSLYLVFAEPEIIENRAFADEAVRLTEQLDQVIDTLGDSGVEVRGAYDITGFGAPGSVFMWLRSAAIDDLQWAKRQLERTLMFMDTVIIDSVITRSVTEIPEEPRMWLSFAPTVPRPADEFDDEDFDDEAFADALLSGEIEALGEDEIDAAELAAADLDSADGGLAGSELADNEFAASDFATSEFAGDSFGEPGAAETDAEREDVDEFDFAVNEELDATSLHAEVGIGPIRVFAAVETDDPAELLGPSVTMLMNSMTAAAAPYTGRRVTTSELYEILR